MLKKRRGVVLFSCVALALAAAGCGNITTTPGAGDGGDAPVGGPDGDGADKGPITVEQACKDIDTSLCNALAGCSTFVLQLSYGDVATCIARNDLACTVEQAQAGVGRTTSDLEACAQAVPAATCPDLVAGKMPVACQDKPGTVINGAACGAATQCQSTFCKRQGACGVCAPRQAAGESCNSDEQCNMSLVCASSACVAPGDAGTSCDDKHPCRTDLYCKSGVCSAKAGAGDSCADTDKACDIVRGVGCNPFTKICQNVRVAKKGDPCGLVAGTLVLCEASGLCEGATLAVPGTCTGAAGDGQACGAADTSGRSCLAPANCVNGICRLPASASCQ